MVRRLVHATVARDQLNVVSFAAGEGVQTGGWDGIVEASTHNAFVPQGVSGWELGTGGDVRRKANNDYGKRRRDPLGLEPAQTTFVFVTPRRWDSKEEWAAEKRAEGVFQDIRAYDAEDLEAWLEQAPGVHTWLSELLGKRPAGVRDLLSFWEDWSWATSPAISPQLTIAGRDSKKEALIEWLHKHDDQIMALQAETKEHATTFLSATVLGMDEEDREGLLSQIVVAEDRDSWQSLVQSDTPLLLVPLFEAGDEVTAATRRGHRVLIPAEVGQPSGSSSIQLPRPQREAARAALQEMGFAEARAEGLAGLYRRSPTAFRRKLAGPTVSSRPPWAQPEEARALLPTLLAGSWEDSNEADRGVISRLAGIEYERVSSTLTQWANQPDPPVRYVGGQWQIASREDAWRLLSNFLTRDDLDRFEQEVLEVLGQRDPALDMPPDQRFMAAVFDKTVPHSHSLREGVAETLALMGARSEATSFTDTSSGQQRADRSVRELLGRANQDWRLWASVAQVLPLLAEASPKQFLEATEDGLSSEEPVLAEMFCDKESSPFMSSPHTGLLRALERLAQNATYLGRTSLVLAKLARLDPGGRFVNRPSHSLHEIYCCWRPQTNAVLSQRLQAIDAIRDREPETAWTLLCDLLPSVSNISHRVSQPIYREWGVDPYATATYAEIFENIRETVNRLLKDADDRADRWRDLIEALPHLLHDRREEIIEALLSFADSGVDTTDYLSLWSKLRRVISRHRQFSEAGWALPEEEVDQLERAYELLRPEDVVWRHAWLFAGHPDLLHLPRDFESRQAELESERIEAVREVWNARGFDGLLQMAEAVEDPGLLGFTLGWNHIVDGRVEDTLLDRHLASPRGPRGSLSRGLLSSAIGKRAGSGPSKRFPRRARGGRRIRKRTFSVVCRRKGGPGTCWPTSTRRRRSATGLGFTPTP